jgi:hypothetical protein
MPEPEVKALPIPNQWKLWRWRPKDRKSLLFGLGFIALAFVMIMARVDVGQQRAAAQAQMNKPNSDAPAITNPTPAQVQQWGQTLKTAEQQYQAAQQYAAAQQALLNGGTLPNGSTKPLTTADLNAAQSQRNGPESNGAAGSGSQVAGGYGTQSDPLKEQYRQLAWKSQFADNVVRQERTQPVSFHPAQTEPERQQPEPEQPSHVEGRSAVAQPQRKPRRSAGSLWTSIRLNTRPTGYRKERSSKRY